MSKTYKIGGVTLTQQALAVFIVSTVSAIGALFLMRKDKIALSAAVFIGMLAAGFYATYLTNCTIVGECKKLAWFLVVMSIIAALAVPVRVKMLKNNIGK
jgi:hypothetical protein